MEEENKIDVLSQAFEHLLYLSDLPNPEIINPKKKITFSTMTRLKALMNEKCHNLKTGKEFKKGNSRCEFCHNFKKSAHVCSEICYGLVNFPTYYF